MDADTLKRNAAARAIEEVKPGMKIGLGTGSTARHFVELLAEKVAGGWNVIGVPTSETTRADAERLGIALTTLDESPELDLTVDGADEIDFRPQCCQGRRWRLVARKNRRCGLGSHDRDRG